MAKKPPVTSARRRAERASGSTKVAASTPQKRPTTTMQRPFQPGTRTSNTTGQRALPPGKKGGPLAKVTKALPPGKMGGALVKTAGKLASRVGFVGTALQTAATANSVFNPKSKGNQQLAKALAAVNKRYSGKSGPRFKNPNTGSVASKVAKSKSPMPKGSGDALREKSYASLQKFTVPKTKTTTKTAAPKTPSATARSMRSSAPARTPASRPAAKPAAKPAISANKTNYPSMYSTVKNFSGGGSSTDPTKSYGTRVNSSFSAESPSSMTKRQSLKEEAKRIRDMIEESKKRQGKG